MDFDEIGPEGFESDEDFADDPDVCPECGDGEDPETWQSGCVDDLCHGGEVPCMHGDMITLACSLCGKRP